jgi:hypothetical protein
MYFYYDFPVNYIRSITQGVKLNDNKKSAGSYMRSLVQSVKVNTALGRFETFYRKCLVTAHNSMKIVRFPSFVRLITAKINATMTISENQTLSRKCVNDVIVNSGNKRIVNALRKAHDFLCGIDNQSFSVLFMRTVKDNTIINQTHKHWGDFIRELAVTADNTAETTHTAEYHRLPRDTVQATGMVFRGLLLFVKIITKVIFRDYLLGRFLKAREELILKSGICREIVLERKI